MLQENRGDLSVLRRGHFRMRLGTATLLSFFSSHSAPLAAASGTYKSPLLESSLPPSTFEPTQNSVHLCLIMDVGPSKKRTRSNTAEDARPATGIDKVQAATRDKDYWFEDGNLVLVSQGVAFKVYKGLLAEHSTVFRSMFHIAQGKPETEDLVDGCPVVTLYDSPNDLRELFQLVYPLSTNLRCVFFCHHPALGSNFHPRFGTEQKVDIAFISAIIRLDHKYELKGLHDRAMSYLTTYYTSNFDAWVDGRNAAQWQPDPVHAIGAINLARLTNTTSILPLAFYICATLGSDLARGFTHSDGSVERLTHEDMCLCLEMKARLAAENAHTAFLLFRPAPAPRHCSNSAEGMYCADLWRKLLEQAGLGKAPHPVASERALDSWLANADCSPASTCTGTSASTPGPPHPFGPPASFSTYMFSYSPPRTLCKGCRSHLEVRDRELRRQIWRKLPEFVGLTIENWDT